MQLRSFAPCGRSRPCAVTGKHGAPAVPGALRHRRGLVNGGTALHQSLPTGGDKLVAAAHNGASEGTASEPPSNGSSSSTSSSNSGTTQRVRMVVPKFFTGRGQSLALVGSIPELGAWSIPAALGMRQLTPGGQRWVAELDLPLGTVLEFKVALMHGAKGTLEPGPSRVLEVFGGTDGECLEVVCQWGRTMATPTVQASVDGVEIAAAAAPPPAPAPAVAAAATPAAPAPVRAAEAYKVPAPAAIPETTPAVAAKAREEPARPTVAEAKVARLEVGSVPLSPAANGIAAAISAAAGESTPQPQEQRPRPRSRAQRRPPSRSASSYRSTSSSSSSHDLSSAPPTLVAHPTEFAPVAAPAPPPKPCVIATATFAAIPEPPVADPSWLVSAETVTWQWPQNMALLEQFSAPPTLLDEPVPIASPGMVVVRVEVPHYRTHTGQRLYLVGDAEPLGRWDPAAGLKLKWYEGHRWMGQVELPAGEVVQAKVVLKDIDKHVWESGLNRAVELPVPSLRRPVSHVELTLPWSRTADTTFVVRTLPCTLTAEQLAALDAEEAAAAAAKAAAEAAAKAAAEAAAAAKAAAEAAAREAAAELERQRVAAEQEARAAAAREARAVAEAAAKAEREARAVAEAAAKAEREARAVAEAAAKAEREAAAAAKLERDAVAQREREVAAKLEREAAAKREEAVAKADKEAAAAAAAAAASENSPDGAPQGDLSWGERWLVQRRRWAAESALKAAAEAVKRAAAASQKQSFAARGEAAGVAASVDTDDDAAFPSGDGGAGRDIGITAAQDAATGAALQGPFEEDVRDQISSAPDMTGNAAADLERVSVGVPGTPPANLPPTPTAAADSDAEALNGGGGVDEEALATVPMDLPGQSAYGGKTATWQRNHKRLEQTGQQHRA